MLQATSILALLFPLALTACGKQDSQPLIVVEQATEAAAENAQTPAGTTSAQTDMDSPLAQRNTLEWYTVMLSDLLIGQRNYT